MLHYSLYGIFYAFLMLSIHSFFTLPTTGSQNLESISGDSKQGTSGQDDSLLWGTITHTYTFTLYKQFRDANRPTTPVLRLWGEPEYPGRTLYKQHT